MAFASKYLNLDYADSEPANNAVGAEVDSPPTSSDTSKSLTSTSGGIGTSWETEQTSLSLLDAKKFELGMDVDGAAVKNSWPWVNYTYLPPSPQFFDPEQYTLEYEVSRLERKLRAWLAKRYAEEAMYGVEKVKKVKKVKSKRRGGKKGVKAREVKTENSPYIVAFSGVVRGRTIYNP